jgi:Tfp pilus assembly protein PilF
MRQWIAQYPFIVAALLGPLLACVLWLVPANAQSADKAALDQLFAQLRVAPDAASAKAIDRQIWTLWMNAGDPALVARMQSAVGKLATDPLQAVSELQSIVADHPTYAEGWNQLATVQFMLGDYDASLAAIDKVLQYEPRHFGALTGRAMIYRNQGTQALALRDMAAALALHPFLSERALFPELLDDVTHI